MRIDSTSVIAYSNQLHKKGAELNDAIFRSPWVPIAGTDLKSEPAIHVRGSIKIANRNDNVVNMAHEQGMQRYRKQVGIGRSFLIVL